MPEAEMVFLKTYSCPVCESKFKNLTVKQGRARLDSTDIDLKPNFKGIETLKYDIVLCPVCGYAALERYFASITSTQRKAVLDKITRSFHTAFEEKETTDFEEACLRFKFAMLSSQVKGVKSSEYGFLSLKYAWLNRAYYNSLEDKDSKKAKELKDTEMSFLGKALDYFTDARAKEQSPICGMDEMTFDCLLAALNIELDKKDDAKKYLSGILVSRTASRRIKDKALELKELLNQDEEEE